MLLFPCLHGPFQCIQTLSMYSNIRVSCPRSIHYTSAPALPYPRRSVGCFWEETTNLQHGTNRTTKSIPRSVSYFTPRFHGIIEQHCAGQGRILCTEYTNIMWERMCPTQETVPDVGRLLFPGVVYRRYPTYLRIFTPTSIPYGLSSNYSLPTSYSSFSTFLRPWYTSFRWNVEKKFQITKNVFTWKAGDCGVHSTLHYLIK